MGDLITPYVKSPCIPEQGVLGHYIDRRITRASSVKSIQGCVSRLITKDDSSIVEAEFTDMYIHAKRCDVMRFSYL